MGEDLVNCTLGMHPAERIEKAGKIDRLRPTLTGSYLIKPAEIKMLSRQLAATYRPGTMLVAYVCFGKEIRIKVRVERKAGPTMCVRST